MENLDVKLVLPKDAVDILETIGLPRSAGIAARVKDGSRVYYLAGPIRGAGDWQAEAIKLLAELDPGCYAVCPCRYDENHPLYQYRVEPDSCAGKYLHQTAWEQVYMRLAMRHGCLIFWLPCESKTNPRPKEEGPYARDTYGELGRYLTHMEYNHWYNIVLGADAEFPGLDQIICNASSTLHIGRMLNGRDIHSFYDTIAVAVQRARLGSPEKSL